jgi:6,7-dimethyl-8-ribityllumazine synthase
VRIAILVSQFNKEVTGGLLWGALEVLKEKNISFDEKDLFWLPGAFEIPLIAKKLALTGRYQAIVALGCVIKGDTAHFEFISLGAAIGIQQVTLETGVPVSFGILTTYTDEQAQARSKKDAHNKGREAALAVIESAQILSSIH